MKNKIFSIFIIILIFLNMTLFTSAKIDNSELKMINEKSNKQIYLGTAIIVGYGNNSELEANLENDLLIKLNSSSSIVDFYIIYDMNCSGLTDEGIITLTVFLNDENVSFNFVQTPTSKNGTLKVENVEIKNRDALTFRINVAYASIIPFYTDSISATGIGIVSKKMNISNKMLIFGSSVDVKLVQLEPEEDYVDLEVLTNSLFIFEEGLFNEPNKILSGAFVRLYVAKGIFLNSIPFCIGFCSDWGIIG